jgi:hypothetical protein
MGYAANTPGDRADRHKEDRADKHNHAGVRHNFLSRRLHEDWEAQKEEVHAVEAKDLEWSDPRNEAEDADDPTRGTRVCHEFKGLDSTPLAVEGRSQRINDDGEDVRTHEHEEIEDDCTDEGGPDRSSDGTGERDGDAYYCIPKEVGYRPNGGKQSDVAAVCSRGRVLPVSSAPRR